MKKRWVVIVILGLVLVSALAALLVGPKGPGPGLAAKSRGAVGIIYIEGTIVGGRNSSGLLTGLVTGSDQVLNYLNEARKDPEVKAVVLRINSPGGSAAASQEIGAEVQRLRRAGKPVVASMGDVAASGGYWVAANADRIVANPATITGSIGVIMQLGNFEELYRKVGIDYEVIKSGAHKDMGSPARELTEKERTILQEMVNDIFDQFVEVVAEGRNLPRDQVVNLADGRIFTGRQAERLGLVDQMGNFRDAVRLAARLAGIEDRFEIREFGRLSPIERLLGEAGGAFFGQGLVPEWLLTLRWKGDVRLVR